ncbi:Lipooligosaccharide galactosyltransferase I [Mannheimia sp. USDA-ARS-USMARC-1261]|uniref:glycosyltransferase family 25 protein n=2 Tax=Mannheimia TaxID=75984 RepID=UPI0003E3492B|nr:glycosyltransferase family 25 protein [Mannheimia sp. USDA-ARS-USMARC-1261]AHG73711.1 Lipooligosaccharide galactosyltransferase I [Mannheimia sp. USDA-ARS-USMARC-1261]
MKKIPIFVINLEKSHERREFIIEQFKSFPEVEYQFFQAINGKENPDSPLFNLYNEHERFKRKGNPMTLSQLGCWASHYLLWKKCLDLGEPIIILEDDANIQTDFFDIYKYLGSDHNIEFCWLTPPSPSIRKNIGEVMFDINSKYQVLRFFSGWGNATGYFLTPSAAVKFLNQSKEWIYNVDITMDRYWENRVDYLAVVPACVRPDSNMGSNIDMKKPKRSLATKLMREYYKLKDNIYKFRYDMNLKNSRVKYEK